MKNRASILSFFLLGLLMAGCSYDEGPLPSDEEPLNTKEESVLKGAKKHTVPFKSRFVMWSTDFYQNEGEAFMHQELEGIGNATHMGKTNVAIPDELLYPGDPWTATADVILTAANGDELWFSYASEFVFVDYPVDVVGDGPITGGTGRFEGASGWMTYTGHWPSEIENGKVTFTGTIQY